MNNFVKSFDAMARAFVAADNDLRGRALKVALSTLSRSARMVGALDIERQAIRVAERIEKSGLDGASREIEQLQKQMDALRISFRSWEAPDGERAERRSIPALVDPEQVAALRQSLRDGSYQAVSIFKTMQPTLVAIFGAARLAALAADMLALRYEQALESLDALFPES